MQRRMADVVLVKAMVVGSLGWTAQEFVTFRDCNKDSKVQPAKLQYVSDGMCLSRISSSGEVTNKQRSTNITAETQ